MKRVGYVMEEIVDRRNLEEAFDYKVRGRVARSRKGRWLITHREEVLDTIGRELLEGTWTPGSYSERMITERGKTRRIQSVTLEKAIALNAVMKVVERHLDPSFITATAASIKGRGMLYLFEQLQRDRRRDPEGTRIVRVDDIRKFYENIPQELAMDCLRRKFKDARLLTVLERCVKLMPHGLSIGLRPSQAIANLVLSTVADHRMKDTLSTRHYYRYCDDTRILTATYGESTLRTRQLHRCLTAVGLEMKPCGQCYDIEHRPIDFLGYRLFGNGRTVIRKSTKQRFARRWARVRSRRRRRELAGSFYGITKHADARHLFKRLTGISMKDFSELGFVYMAQDGKKRFDEPMVSLSELQNRTIEVKDFETDIKTREGDGRYIVQFHCDDRQIGDGKFITNSEELKQALLMAREQNFLPFRTTVKRVTFGKGKSKYQFT